MSHQPGWSRTARLKNIKNNNNNNHLNGHAVFPSQVNIRRKTCSVILKSKRRFHGQPSVDDIGRYSIKLFLHHFLFLKNCDRMNSDSIFFILKQISKNGYNDLAATKMFSSNWSIMSKKKLCRSILVKQPIKSHEPHNSREM